MPFTSADPAGYLAVGMQSGLGSPQTTAAKFRFAKYLSGTDAQPAIEVVDLREGGDGLDYGFTYKKSQKVTGALVVNGRPEIIGQLLPFVPGGATWGGASGPAVHTYHTSHASHPWATLQLAYPATSLVHFLSDVRFSGFTVEGNAGEPQKWTFPFVGINHGASAAALTPTYYGDALWVFHNAPSYIIDGTADSDITAYRFEMGLGLEELQSQAVTLDEIVVQNRDTNVEVTRRYEDPTLWKKINMGAGVSPTTSVATGSFETYNEYGAGAALRSIDLVAPLVSWRGDALSEIDPDGKTVMETISGKALKGATHTFFAVLKNAHASAYSS